MTSPSRDVGTILLVDDDPFDVELTLSALTEDGLAARTLVAADGAEALDYLLRRGRFHERGDGDPVVVLLDNKMPRVSGLDLLKVMRSDPRLRAIPVVAFSSSREPSDLTEFYAHGVNAYVVKPVESTEFRSAVGRLGRFWALVNEPPIEARFDGARLRSAGIGPSETPRGDA